MCVYVYNGILLSHQKEWNLAICSDVDGARVYYAKWNKSVRERQNHMISVISVIYETKQINRGREKTRQGEKIRD